MTVDDLMAFLAENFPQIDHFDFTIEHLDAEGIRLRLPFKEAHLRPGGTISGPTMMSLADTAAYLTILSRIGPVPLAVTTSLNINFLRRPRQADLIGEGALLKLGRRLAVAEVSILSDGEPDPVAHVTVTYSLPPARGGA